MGCWRFEGGNCGASRRSCSAELGYIGGVEGAVERLKAQDEAGVDLRPIDIDAHTPAEFEKTVARLLR